MCLEADQSKLSMRHAGCDDVQAFFPSILPIPLLEFFHSAFQQISQQLMGFCNYVRKTVSG